MAIKIDFNVNGMPEQPTMVLARRDGSKIGLLNPFDINLKGALNEANEFQFRVYKNMDGVSDPYWDELTNFKLIWCKEWNLWFDITVEIDETNPENIVKNISCVGLGESELSQILLHDIKINGEDDWALQDKENPDAKEYIWTVLYNESDPKYSMLHRLLEKAPHYQVVHVDSTVANEKAEFEFDGDSIYDALQDIAEEFGCLFNFDCKTDENGELKRTIAVYDLQTYCNSCKHRGEFTDTCPKCGSTDLNYGYGEDTTIFITSDALGNEIELSTDTDAVKNCFYLEGGDDLMTATIRNCNPNGTSYLWYFSEDLLKEMPQQLQDKIKDYNELYEYYQNEYSPTIDSTILSNYNALIDKYLVYNEELEKINLPIKGYPALMNALYNAIDFGLYLESSLMPTYKLQDTTAAAEAEKLTASALSPIALTNIKYISVTVANNAVLAMAEAIIDPRYKVTVDSSNVSDTTWIGTLTVTNLSAEDDTATTPSISITLTDDMEAYLKQQIDKALSKGDSTDVSISGLFKRELASFKAEIKKYSLNGLKELRDAAQTCLNILIEQGVTEDKTWSAGDPNLYDDLYIPYYQKLEALEAETVIRENEIALINGTTNEDGSFKTKGLQNELYNARDIIQEALNFEKYLGEDLWFDFCSYRREDDYSNDHYTSESLDNAQLFERAMEFIETASNEIYKSAELQHSISTSLKNLLVLKEFQPILQYFEVGNWIRVQVDEIIYRLRLLDYEIDYDDLKEISVTFSDVKKLKTGMSDMQSVISSAKSMATSYDSVKHQASQGSDSKNILDGWSLNGLDVTTTRIVNSADNQDIVYDKHGMLFRKYEPIIDDYLDEQLKIVNSTIAITDDNWETTRTAIGRFYFYDPANNNQLTSAYGINAEVLVGQLILGESLGIYNSGGTLTFDKNGFIVQNDSNKIIIDPNGDSLFSIQKKSNDTYKDIFYIDDDGNMHMTGIINWDETNTPILSIDDVTGLQGNLDGLSSQIATFKDGVEGMLGTTISPTAIISPKIGGGYLYISDGTAAVSIDPKGLNNGYIFDVSYNNSSVMGIDSSGNGYFKGAITATSGTIGGFTIGSSSIASSNGVLTLNNSGTIVSKSGSHTTTITNGAIELINGPLSIILDGSRIELGGRGSSAYIGAEGGLVVDSINALDIWASEIITANTSLWSNGTAYIGSTLTLENGMVDTGNGRFTVRNPNGDTMFSYYYSDTAGRYIFRCQSIYDHTSTSAANVRVSSSGGLARSSSSSKRYKTNILPITHTELNPKQLYNINVVEFTYKYDYLTSSDPRNQKPIIGFIAEDIETKYPIAVDYNEDGTVETWNERIMIPAMLKLIQDQHTTLLSHDSEITLLRSQLESMEFRLQQAFELIAEQKKIIESLTN